MSKHTSKHRIVVPRRKRIEGGWNYEIVGEDHVTVNLTIDIDALVQELGRQAWRNKTKKATLGSGMITAIAVPTT